MLLKSLQREICMETEIVKMQKNLSGTITFEAKVSKTQCFSILFGSC